MINLQNIQNRLAENGLKSTTQRLVIFEALCNFKNHPTAEDVFNSIREQFPSISLSTVYNTLDLFYRNGIISIVKTSAGIVRYDTVREHHHHLYCAETNKIEDYFNQELDSLLSDFFDKHKINNFDINEVKLQIRGKFNNQVDTENRLS